MQLFTKRLLLTLLWSLATAQPSATQTTSQKQWQNERPPPHRFPRMPRVGPFPFLSESRSEITNRKVSAVRDSNTTLIGRWVGGACDAVAVVGTRAYFGNGPLLMIADISDPSKPTELGKVLLPGVGDIIDITVSGNLAYVAAGYSGLRIIAVSNFANPTEAGFFAKRVFWWSEIHRLQQGRLCKNFSNSTKCRLGEQVQGLYLNGLWRKNSFIILGIGQTILGRTWNLLFRDLSCYRAGWIQKRVQQYKESNNIMSYIRTRLFRFLVLLNKPTQHATNKVYSLVPMQDFSELWTDEKLYKKYDLTKEEIAFIESRVRPMEASDE
jgi:hypothetical protein